MVTRKLARGHKSITIPSLILVVLSTVWLLYKVILGTLSTIDILFFLGTILLLIFNLQFFRDPLRIPDDSNVLSIISPADGVLFEIDTTSEPDTTIYRIRMRFWDVHVNYMPLDGKLNSCTKKRGVLLPILPGLNKYSKNKNARQTMVFESDKGFEFKVIQISGTLAYRTVAYGKETDYFKKAHKIGMIRYGSETDLHLPTTFSQPVARIGQKVKAGKTIISQLKGFS